MRIVYVEDSPSNAALIERICSMSKDDLIIYEDAEQALQDIEPGTADLVLIDVHLGDHSMNGLELTNLLRQKGVATPVVIITAYDPSGYPEQFEACDFNEYIPKPVSISGMINLLDAYRSA